MKLVTNKFQSGGLHEKQDITIVRAEKTVDMASPPPVPSKSGYLGLPELHAVALESI